MVSSFEIQIYLIDEGDVWESNDSNDTFDIYRGSVSQYWIEVNYTIDYTIDSKPVHIYDGSS